MILRSILSYDSQQNPRNPNGIEGKTSTNRKFECHCSMAIDLRSSETV